MSAKAVGTIPISKPSSLPTTVGPMAGAAGSLDGVHPVVLRRTDGKSEEKPGTELPVSLAATAASKIGFGITSPAKFSLPSIFDMATKFKRRSRFQNVSGGSVSKTISVLELIGSQGGVCTVVNSTVVHWVSSFKILEIKVWPPSSAANTQSVVLEWNTGLVNVKDESMACTIPAGMTMPTCLTFTPPPKTLSGDWISVAGSSTNLFNVFNLPNLAVLDLTIECSLPIAFASSTLSSTVATGILGQVYYLALDGPSSNTITPIVGYPTTH